MRYLVVGDFQGNFSEKLKKKISREEFDAVIGVGDYTGLAEWRPYIMVALRLSREGLPVIPVEEFFGKKRYKRLLKKDEDSAKKVLKTLNGFGKPVIMVFGNGDDDWYKYKFSKGAKVDKKRRKFLKNLKHISDITYGNKRMSGIDFVGFGGYMDIDAYFDKEVFKGDDGEQIRRRIERRERSKKDLFRRVKKLDKKSEKLFVLHYPPQGVFDIIRDRKDNPMNGHSAGIGFFREAIIKHKPKIVFCGHMHEYYGVKKIGKTLVINPGDAEKGKFAIVDFDDETGKVKARFIR